MKIASLMPSRYQRFHVQTWNTSKQGCAPHLQLDVTLCYSACTSHCAITSLSSTLAGAMAAWFSAAHGSICTPHQAALLSCSADLAPGSICTQRAPLGATLCTQILLLWQLPRARGRLLPAVGGGALQQDPVFLPYPLCGQKKRKDCKMPQRGAE